MKKIKKKKYLSTSEIGAILGISRQAVLKKIDNGQIPAIKIGDRYAIEPKALGLGDAEPSETSKKQIRKAIKKTLDEYEEALRKLGDE